MMSSLYIGTTGMKSLSENMGVITNNLANINTLGYKKQSMLFQDLMSQTQTSSGSNYITNMSQVGMGSGVADVRTLFINGGFESGSAATDLSIDGIGFFGVVNNSGGMEYTRAGDFRFTADGNLVDPAGWNLMGYKVVNGVQSNAIEPIKVDLTGGLISAAKPSTEIVNIAQLGNIIDKSTNATNPFFSMASGYDGTKDIPLNKSDYSYAQALEYYDNNGVKQTATIYFDKAGTSNGSTAMEYVVALPPGQDASGLAGTQASGLLMAGTLTFSNTGAITNMTAFTPPASGTPSSLGDWQAANFQNGYPVINLNRTGSGPQSISLNMGLQLADGTNSGLTTAADAAGSPDSIYTAATGAQRAANATNNLGTSNASKYMSTNGYAQGELRDLSVSSEGLVQAVYSNGQTEDLYTIPLYRFTSQDGLRREGKNHYSATPDSGDGVPGVPGTENYGKLNSWSLETANVDYAEEFTQLIITQRGFQSNSKVITTSDAMLQKAMEIKRS